MSDLCLFLIAVVLGYCCGPLWHIAAGIDSIRYELYLQRPKAPDTEDDEEAA